MIRRSELEGVAEMYRKEGYEVTVSPAEELLPKFLANEDIGLVAKKGSENVAVQIRARGEAYDLQPDLYRFAEQQGWRLDVVVYPPNTIDDLPRNGASVRSGYVQELIQESEKLIRERVPRAAVVISWSAVEAAMREAAQREGVEPDRPFPRDLLKSLYSNGVISREDYTRSMESMEIRNQVVHGFAPENLSLETSEYLADFAARLIGELSADPNS
jgi:hypothetical protein